MFFWNSLLAIWSLVPLPFLKPAWTSGSSRFRYCWSLAWRILSITLLACAAAAAKSLQSCPTLCDPIDGSPPGSASLGFSRQEHWSGLPFPSPMHESGKWKWSHSVVRWVQLCGSLSILWHWNENWPFLILWPLLSFLNLLAYWVQHFYSIIFLDLK